MNAAVRQTYLPTSGADPATGRAAAFARVELPGGCRDLLRAVAELQAGRPEWTGPRRELASAAGCAVDTVTRRTKVCVEAGYLDHVSRSGRSCTWSVRAADVIDRPHAPRRLEPATAPAPPRRRSAQQPTGGAVAAPPAPVVSRGAQLREGWATLRRGVVLIVAALLWPRETAPAPAPRPGERRGDAFQPFLFADPPAPAAPAAAPALSTGGAGAAPGRRRGDRRAPVSTAAAPVSTPPAPALPPTKQAVSPAGAPAAGGGFDTGAGGAAAAPSRARTMEPIPSHEPTSPQHSQPTPTMGRVGSDSSGGGKFKFARSLNRADLADPAIADRLYREAAASPLTNVRADDPGHRERFVAACLSIAASDCKSPAGVLVSALRGGRSAHRATWLTRGNAKELEQARQALKALDPPPPETARPVGVPLPNLAPPELTPRTGVNAAERDRQVQGLRARYGAEYLAGVAR